MSLRADVAPACGLPAPAPGISLRPERFRADRMPASTLARHFAREHVEARRRWLTEVTGEPCAGLFSPGLQATETVGNIENFIGTLQVPVGIAGPLRVRGDDFERWVPLPVATTEGALVRSLHRGAMLCNLAGGVRVHVARQRMARAPAFLCASFDDALALERWLRAQEAALRREAERCSRHAQLTGIETLVFDRTVHLELAFSTGDAAGQNMVTACAWQVCEWVRGQLRSLPEIRLERCLVEGNLSGDKKACARSRVLGRGHAVTATCEIPERLLRRYFGVDAATYLEGYHIAAAGAAHADMAGCNINFANVIAALFLATGQDVASVHEAAAGHLQMRPTPGGVALAASLPALVVGAVGGGTGLPTQAECLALMGCSGAGRAARLAAIIGAACLALDLSTGGAIAGGHFAAAHERLGRNRPEGPATRDGEGEPGRTPRAIEALLGLPVGSVQRCTAEPLRSADDVMGRIRHRAGTGTLRRCRIAVAGEASPRSLVVKSSTAGEAIEPLAGYFAAVTGDPSLAGLLEAGAHTLGLAGAGRREWAFYRDADPAFRALAPAVAGLAFDRRSDHYVIALEDLAGCRHLAGDDRWYDEDIEAVIEAMARLHALGWQQRPAWLRPSGAEGAGGTDAEHHALGQRLRAKLLELALRSGEVALPATARQALERQLAAGPADFPAPFATVIHNDLSTRNVCLRPRADGGRAVLYDWEFVTFGAPQRDLVEFLTHALPPERFEGTFPQWVGRYLAALARLRPDAPDPAVFWAGIAPVARELFLTRTVPLALLRRSLDLRYLEPVIANLAPLLAADLRRAP